VGQDDWTTLPEAGGQTTDDVGQSCDIDWNTIHPFLDHYQTNPTPAADCTNHGTTGAWNGATGNSGGWHQWDVDLSAYAGKQVEISITYAQDFASAGLGVFLDEVQVTGVDATPEGFESGTLGAWTAGPPPAGTANQAGWVASTTVGFTDGPGVATKQTELWGFGLEGVRGADKRAALLGDALHYLAGNQINVPPMTPVEEPVDQPTTTAPPVAAPAPVTAASVTVAQKPLLLVAKRYKADRKGRVKVRVRCVSSVTCKGKVRLLQKKKVLAAKSYTIRAGKTSTVMLKLKKTAFKHLKKVNKQRVTLRLLTGSAKVVKSSTITLREP
jgi:hypothetical protein